MLRQRTGTAKANRRRKIMWLRREDSPCMRRLPINGKTSHIREDFPSTGRLPMYPAVFILYFKTCFPHLKQHHTMFEQQHKSCPNCDKSNATLVLSRLSRFQQFGTASQHHCGARVSLARKSNKAKYNETFCFLNKKAKNTWKK